MESKAHEEIVRPFVDRIETLDQCYDRRMNNPFRPKGYFVIRNEVQDFLLYPAVNDMLDVSLKVRLIQSLQEETGKKLYHKELSGHYDLQWALTIIDGIFEQAFMQVFNKMCAHDSD